MGCGCFPAAHSSCHHHQQHRCWQWTSTCVWAMTRMMEQ